MSDVQIIMNMACAIIHYQEHIETGEPIDLAAAKGNLSHPAVKKWLKDNAALLPLKRSVKSG